MANPNHLAILEEGVEAWNHWRQINVGVIPDLSGADLSGLELTNIDLSHANIQGTKFIGSNLANSNFDYSKAGIRSGIESLVLASTTTFLSLFSGFFAISVSWALSLYVMPETQPQALIVVFELFLIGFILFPLYSDSLG